MGSLMSEFFDMGGYGFYVWTSYALAFIVLTVNLVKPLYCQRRMKRSLVRKARLTRRHA